MLSKANAAKVLCGILTLILCVFSNLSYADWSIGVGVGNGGYHHDYYGWHDHPGWGYHVHYLPRGYFTVWVGGARYYYYDGLYYSYVGNGDYILVDPPIGAHVSAIPPDFQPVLINGMTYYTNGGVYYVLTQYHGYKVVPAPVVYAQPPQVVYTQPAPPVVAAPAPPPANAMSAPADPDTFPVNIPNNSGGYTTVVVKKSGNGYVGPQGEFYATFPTVTQLKAMYVK